MLSLFVLLLIPGFCVDVYTICYFSFYAEISLVLCEYEKKKNIKIQQRTDYSFVWLKESMSERFMGVVDLIFVCA